MVRRVFEATLELLAAQGYERLSVPEVAERAGLNKTSVYRRWPTKGDLVREALEASMAPQGPLPDTGELRGDLLAFARSAVGFVESPLGEGVLRTLLAGGPSPEVRAFAASVFRQQEGAGPRQVFARAVARGELPASADVTLVLKTLAGALMHRLLIEQARCTDAYLERLIDLVLLGITSRRGR